jgi:hypothetical protein
MENRTQISWLPIDFGRNDDGLPFWHHANLHPVGVATNHQYKQADALFGITCDEEIADLVSALNRAGIDTLLSCQDILMTEDDEQFDDTPRIGCVTITWDSFPILNRILREHKIGLDTSNKSGWLFAILPDIPSARPLEREFRKPSITVLFPWRDLAAFTSALKAHAPESGLTGS